MFNNAKTAHLFQGRAPREEGERHTAPNCFCIWDTEAGEYVIKKQSGYGGGGRGRKAFWQSRGAAKNAGMILIGKDYHAMAAKLRAEGKKPPARVGRFDDQTRYEVHEMALKRVDGEEPRYVLLEAQGLGGWLLVPEKRVKELPLFVTVDNKPVWARVVRLSSLKIVKPEFE